MRVSKWGNSLAVRLPADVIEALGLKDGDDIDIVGADYAGKTIGVARKLTKLEVLEELRKFRGVRPGGFMFNREEANER